jgi:hypothetical protein
MRASIAWLTVLGVAGVSAACSKSAPPPGKSVALDQVCDEPAGGHVRLTGYVRYRREMLSFCSSFGGHKTCDLQLFRAPRRDSFLFMTPVKDVQRPMRDVGVAHSAQIAAASVQLGARF